MKDNQTPAGVFPPRARGFTLVEAMIVVAIIAILGAIAYPSYRDQMRRSHRSEGQALLLDAAARQERFFANNNTYATTVGALNAPATSEHGYYALSVVSADGVSFNMQVQAQGGQADDTQCNRMRYSSIGVKAAFASDSSDTTSLCWR